MKKIDLGQWITILANAGVIAGIVFLGFELRQNTTATRVESAQGIQDQIFSIYQMLLIDPMPDIYLRGMESFSTLSAEEQLRFSSFWDVTLQAYQNLYLQTKEGVYAPERGSGWWQNLRNNFDAPGFEEYWETRNYILSAEFREFVAQDVFTLAVTEPFTPLDGASE